MEKLRPIIKQIFWIGTGFVVLLAVGGWWMAMGSLSESIKKDKATLEGRVKASKAGGDAPNDQWALRAGEVNQAYQAEFSKAELDLHRSQMSTRRFPSGPGGEELARISFFKPINDRPLRMQYKELYLDHFLEQIEILDPFIVEENRGLIDVNPAEIHHADMSLWNDREPTSSEIWSAQEDLWLLRSLFGSIARVNAGSERLGTSPVRQLVSLQLRGGSTANAVGGAGGGGGAFGGSAGGAFGGSFGIGALSGGMADDDGSYAAGASTGPARAGSGGPHPGLAYAGSFDTDLLSEEFGPPPSGTGGTARSSRSGGKKGKGRDDDFGGATSWDQVSTPSPSTLAAATSATGDNDLAAEVKARYVDDKAEYRTRAFLLHVRVAEDDIPSLLAELTNSSFPVEIVRVSAQFNEGVASTPGRASGISSRRGGMDDDDDDGRGLRLGGKRGKRGGIGLFSGRRPAGGFQARGRKLGGRVSGGQGIDGLLSTLARNDYDANLAAKGEQQRQAALDDVTLAEIRIGGLLTLYRTKEENLAAKETVELDIKETLGEGEQSPNPEPSNEVLTEESPSPNEHVTEAEEEGTREEATDSEGN
jgi:hypothetical protein